MRQEINNISEKLSPQAHLLIDRIAKDILQREGGFVNDPDDLGGATNYGVTLETLKRLGFDLTQDGKIDQGDLKALTPKKVQEIFVQHYFYAPKLMKLPNTLWASVFDMYVNSGRNAVKILQRLLNEMRLHVTIDGVIGPQTLNAVHKAASAAPDHLADAYAIARRDYYYQLGDLRVKNRKYARRKDGGKGGWITRAESFLSPKYHLTLNSHKERVSKWV